MGCDAAQHRVLRTPSNSNRLGLGFGRVAADHGRRQRRIAPGQLAVHGGAAIHAQLLVMDVAGHVRIGLQFDEVIGDQGCVEYDFFKYS
ncbi:hypothetical protein SAMN05216466_122111 [Paraburkholderia phenazinium]|uniref:Uncharacterized protein n=1 Tax=Paraburkholderia phenazinium TaxID=60549 RepID=A0A1G8KEX7_9BURK|nr:hypothetical protein SAMN05216466_122111 [Paraburkholderia phenazinium]